MHARNYHSTSSGISEEPSLQGREHQLDHDTIECVINNVVRGAMIQSQVSHRAIDG